MKIILSLLVGIVAWLLVFFMGMFISYFGALDALGFFAVAGFFVFIVVSIVHYESK